MCEDLLRSLLLHRDSRGVATAVLHDALEVARVAHRLAQTPPTSALIVTGFFVGNRPETDGPLGAFFLGKALVSMGWKVCFSSRPDCLHILRDCVDYPADYHDFPLSNAREGSVHAREILTRTKPACVFTIEVSGHTATGKYLNMRGVDIGDVTPRLDCFLQEAASLGIWSVSMADGGNEAGFGNAPADLVRGKGIEPCSVAATHLLVGSVSNWVVYVLLACLSRELGRRVSPLFEEEHPILCRMVELGAVDGFSGQSKPCVDGRGAEEHCEFFAMLEDFRLGRLKMGVSAHDSL